MEKSTLFVNTVENAPGLAQFVLENSCKPQNKRLNKKILFTNIRVSQWFCK